MHIYFTLNLIHNWRNKTSLFSRALPVSKFLVVGEKKYHLHYNTLSCKCFKEQPWGVGLEHIMAIWEFNEVFKTYYDVLTAVLPLLYPCIADTEKHSYQKHIFACQEDITTPHLHGRQEEFLLLITSETKAWEWWEASTLLTDSLTWEHRTVTNFIFCVRFLRGGRIKKQKNPKQISCL